MTTRSASWASQTNLVEGVLGVVLPVGQQDADKDGPFAEILPIGALQFSQGGFNPRWGVERIR
jgi:hypothetical protein